MDRKINIENYEEFFIDYLDGNLSDAEIIALENFLLNHPELRKELEGMEEVKLTGDPEIKFPLTENLKQLDLSLPVSDANFEFFCIAEMEGDLSIEEKQALEIYLQENPEKKKTGDQIKMTILQADPTELYPEKRNLKKALYIVFRREIRIVAAIAAGIVLLLAFWFSFLDNNPVIDSMAVAGDKEKTSVETADSTAVSPKSDSKGTDQPEGKSEQPLNLPEKSRQAVRKAAAKISFKVGIPVASVQDSLQGQNEPAFDRESYLKGNGINTRVISSVTPLSRIDNDPLIPVPVPYTQPAKKYEDPGEYLTLQEFAVQKLSDIIFREEKRELNAINLASAGIDKINNVAGTNMKLEASAKNETGEKVLSFNSKIISFSTPINRED